MHRDDPITSILQVHKFKTYSKMKLISFLNAGTEQKREIAIEADKNTITYNSYKKCKINVKIIQ